MQKAISTETPPEMIITTPVAKKTRGRGKAASVSVVNPKSPASLKVTRKRTAKSTSGIKINSCS